MNWYLNCNKFSIIQFNNSQNKITASDFRSTDSIQKRLREEFKKIPDAEYLGGRRGGISDQIQRNSRVLPSYSVGQALAAFHQEPIVAYNKKTEIWNSDKVYSKLFNENTNAPHIVFAFALLKAIEDKKIQLNKIKVEEPNKFTKSVEKQVAYFRNRGATFLLVSAVSNCLETILEKAIPNPFRLSFGFGVSPVKAKDHWTRILDLIIPLVPHLENAFTSGIKNSEKVLVAIENFKMLFEATIQSNKRQYSDFARKIKE